MFRKVENLAYKYIVTMLVFNIDAHEEIYTLQNIYLGRNIYLKEGQTRKDRVEIG